MPYKINIHLKINIKGSIERLVKQGYLPDGLTPMAFMIATDKLANQKIKTFLKK